MAAPAFPRSKRRLGLLLLTLPLLALSQTGCGITDPDDDPEQTEFKVLFIGNSLLGWHDTPLMFKQLAHAGGREITIGNQVVNGTSLQEFAQTFETTWMIRQEPWDFVVLQSSGTEVAYPGTHLGEHSLQWALGELDRIIHENHADTKTVWMLPWAWEDGVRWNDGTTEDYATVQGKIRVNAVRWADSLGLTLAPVGMAWYEILKDDPAPHYLHDSDQTHPNMRGTYLSAATFYATLFRETAQGLDFFSVLEESEANTLLEVGSRTVLDSLSLWNITP